MVPAFLAFFVHSGPFAWSGAFGFYIPLTAYSIWIGAVMTVCIKRAPR